MPKKRSSGKVQPETVGDVSNSRPQNTEAGPTVCFKSTGGFRGPGTIRGDDHREIIVGKCHFSSTVLTRSAPAGQLRKTPGSV